MAHIMKDTFNNETAILKLPDVPILILHGDSDKLVDISHSKALVDKLEEKTQHKFHTMQNCSHTVYDCIKDVALPIKDTMEEWNI